MVWIDDEMGLVWNDYESRIVEETDQHLIIKMNWLN